jgi:hypothetical protein
LAGLADTGTFARLEKGQEKVEIISRLEKSFSKCTIY